MLVAVYPAVWGAGQLVTGALSDRLGRKWLIVAGMWLQAAALGLVALGTTFAVLAGAAVLLGAGTAMVYPALLAAIGDVTHPAWRARAVGVYRLWRDGGFAVAHYWPASSPTPSAWSPQSGWSPPSPPPRAWWLPSGCTRRIAP